MNKQVNILCHNSAKKQDKQYNVKTKGLSFQNIKGKFFFYFPMTFL